MSVYEDYDRASHDYAKLRLPVGVEILIGVYTLHLGDLSQRCLVDIGCGAGIYSRPLADWFGTVRGFDISPGQIEQAVAKCADVGNVDFQVADAKAMPFEDNSADAALASLMLHHIENESGSIENHRTVIAEAFRVLRTGGVLVLGICTQQQVYDGAWYCRLMPRASEILAARHPRPERLISLAGEAGFYHSGTFVPVDEVLQGPGYFDGRGILRQEWRNGDSIFSLLSQEELSDLLARVRAMDDQGLLDDYVRDHDEVRRNIGQVTFLAFTKGWDT